MYTLERIFCRSLLAGFTSWFILSYFVKIISNNTSLLCTVHVYRTFCTVQCTVVFQNFHKQNKTFCHLLRYFMFKLNWFADNNFVSLVIRSRHRNGGQRLGYDGKKLKQCGGSRTFRCGSGSHFSSWCGSGSESFYKGEKFFSSNYQLLFPKSFKTCHV